MSNSVFWCLSEKEFPIFAANYKHQMKAIGFIGAGKLGSSFGRYLKDKGLVLSGYYDEHKDAADYAASRTESTSFASLQALLQASEVVFVTVPDDMIAPLWLQCSHFPLAGKFFFHCSGVLGSNVFSGAQNLDIHVGSAHPVCAVRSRDNETAFFGKFFVLEGDQTGLEMLKSLMQTTGNTYQVIAKADKAKYHAAAVASSNLICALAKMSEDWLRSCSFDTTTAHQLLVPLMLSNVENIAEKGCIEALTGPVERGDTGTVAKHLGALDGNDRDIYRLLSVRLLDMAREKHPDKDYTHLFELLKK